jgi:hypothetical protein
MKWVLVLLSLVGSLALAEVLVRSIDLFPEERLATRVQDHANAAESDPQGRFLLHPFLGYAGNPAYERGLIGELALSRTFPGAPSPYYLRNSRINAHGFPSEHADYAADAEGSTSASLAARSGTRDRRTGNTVMESSSGRPSCADACVFNAASADTSSRSTITGSC